MKSRARQFTVAGNLLLFAVEAMDGLVWAWHGGGERSKELRKAMPAAPCGYRLRFCKGKSSQTKQVSFVTRESKKSEAAQCLGGMLAEGVQGCWTV